MRITELLDKRSIRIDGAPKSKNEALDQMVELMAKSGKINDLEAYRQEVYRREEEGTTGVGEGIAIPHGKGAFVDKPGLAAMVVKDGVDYDSLDGEPVHLIFLIAAPNTKDNVHLDVLSKLSVLLMDEDFSRALQNAKSPEEFMKIVDEADQEAPDLDEKLKADEATSEDQFRILAVTACPTGIAHTYMAAEGLEKAAKAKGCFIKVETRGSGGAKNVLTAVQKLFGTLPDIPVHYPFRCYPTYPGTWKSIPEYLPSVAVQTYHPIHIPTTVLSPAVSG